MLDTLPVSLLVDWLTDGPMVFISPEMLRKLSKSMKRTMDAVFMADGFWQKFMRACFPSFGTRLPRQFAEMQLPANRAWRLFAHRIISDFGSLYIEVAPVAAFLKSVELGIITPWDNMIFYKARTSLVEAKYLDKLTIKDDVFLPSHTGNMNVFLCTKTHRRMSTVARSDVSAHIIAEIMNSGLNPERKMNMWMDPEIYFSKITPASIECWLDYLPLKFT